MPPFINTSAKLFISHSRRVRIELTESVPCYSGKIQPCFCSMYFVWKLTLDNKWLSSIIVISHENEHWSFNYKEYSPHLVEIFESNLERLCTILKFAKQVPTLAFDATVKSVSGNSVFIKFSVGVWLSGEYLPVG